MFERRLVLDCSIRHQNANTLIGDTLDAGRKSFRLFDFWKSKIDEKTKEFVIPSSFSSESVSVFSEYINNNSLPEITDEALRAEVVRLATFTVSPDLV